MQPTVSKEFMEMGIPWSAEMLRQDLEPSQIRKFDGFCCVPDHLDYKEIVGNFYNLYHRLEGKPEPGSDIDRSNDVRSGYT